tara:strand:+ start:691 stop:954 length:264 start_codon:yes stop_codon:yes gene_type:complete
MIKTLKSQINIINIKIINNNFNNLNNLNKSFIRPILNLQQKHELNSKKSLFKIKLSEVLKSKTNIQNNIFHAKKDLCFIKNIKSKLK